jgi:hypothetical protein
MPKAEISNRNFSLRTNPLLLLKNLLRVAFCLQKDNKTDHLEDKKLLTTTKSQEFVKLTIDNPQLHSH